MYVLPLKITDAHNTISICLYHQHHTKQLFICGTIFGHGPYEVPHLQIEGCLYWRQANNQILN